MISRDLVTSIWHLSLSSLLFYKAKYFSIPYVSSFADQNGFSKLTPFIYHVTFFDVILLVLVYLLLRNQKKNKQESNVTAEIFILLLVIFVGSISSAYSFFSDVSWFSLFQLFKFSLLFLVSTIVFKNKKLFAVTIKSILIFIFFNSLLIIFQKLKGGPLGLVLEDFSNASFGSFSDESSSLFRPGGIYFQPNLSASLINLILPFVLLKMYFAKSKIENLFYLIGLVVIVLALVLTASRINWIVALLLFFTFHIFFSKKEFTRPISFSKSHKIIFFAILLTQVKLIFTRMLSLVEAFTLDNGGFLFRVRHFQIATYFMKRRMFGIGLDTFQYQILNSFEPSYYFFHFTSPHNIFLEIGSGLGLIGLILFFAFFTMIGKKIVHSLRVSKWQTKEWQIFTLAMGYSSYIISGMFYPWLFAPPLSELSWIYLGGIYAWFRQNR